MISNKHNKIKNSANDLYDIYTFPDSLHEYKEGHKITEGINNVAVYENCFWLLDLILNQQVHPGLDCEVQNWELQRIEDGLFDLSCSYENDITIHKVKGLEVGFYFDDFRIMKKGNIFCLPIEKELY
ncbi:hypothetical protein EGY07_19700 [Chryseobacterium indologenes]|uniref:DUF6876 domain-containing protein n=1 Tax=Chryseobacterium indologenes TaxID=253 RepID=A0A1Z3W6R9_CHRID|nr:MULTISPECIES: DUF6876 family protein [Chryseobacterium]ASE63478.1 hypothetical protein CEQ15_19335 [Chryseobacterium indologenes]ATN07473.1 hypothetical protein CRN76_19775 [Chryseobacterium indologenes]AYY83789.1 hypothetical protein EGX91_04050 [Chryseobacterium indologenes]AYZ37607.1 hypothetical protein EGY07_19700 [Chryseobacterium indologenes]AZB19192.1 hypothetical protein EG352_16125 [Chryseobacterium indologenes]